MVKLPVLESERIILTELKSADIPQITSYADNENISAYTLNLPSPYTEKDAVYWINLANQGLKNATHYIFGIRVKPQIEFIGGIGLTVEQRFKRAEIGYWIAEPFWNKGYATEATELIVKFGFETLRLNKLTSSHLDKNPASGKVMIKNEMIKEGELKEHILKGSTYHSLILYGLTRGDYEKNKYRA